MGDLGRKLKFLFKEHKDESLIGSAVCLVISILIAGAVSFSNANIAGDRRGNIVWYFIYAFLNPGLLIVVSLLIEGLFLFVLIRKWYVDDNATDDPREFADTGEYGMASVMSKERAETIFPVYAIEDKKCVDNIIGWANKSIRLVYTCSLEVGNFNGHKMITAKSGAGKTTSGVFTDIEQIIRRGESFVVTDTSGETPVEFAEYCRTHGYTTRIINFIDPLHSDGFNPLVMFDYSKDPVLTGNMIANLIAMNCTEDGLNNYFTQYTTSFLSFLLIFMAKPWEDKSRGGCSLDENNRNLPEMLRLALQNRKSLINELTNMDDENPAKIAAASWASTDQKHQEQPVQTVQAWLAPLLSPAIKQMMNHNDTDLRAPGLTKCAYFVSVPVGAEAHTLYWMAALLYGAMIDVLLKVAYEHNGVLPVPVNLIFDEFPNIFRIPNWTQTLNNIRKHKIRATMICQGLEDLERAYPKGARSLINACDISVFLGTNDIETAEFYSKRSMEATVKTRRKNIYGGPLFNIQSPTETESNMKSYVYDTGMLMQLNPDPNECHYAVVFASQQNCFKVDTVYYKEHPLYKELVHIPVSEHIPIWKQREQKESAADYSKNRQENEVNYEGEPNTNDQEAGDISNDQPGGSGNDNTKPLPPKKPEIPKSMNGF